MISGRIWRIIIIVLIPCFFWGCRKERFTKWETENLFPLAKGKFTLKKLSFGDLEVRESGSSYKLVFSYPLMEIKMDTLLKIPDTTLSKNVSLETLKLDNRKIEDRITLGDVARNAGPSGQFIIDNHGKRRPIPEINGISPGIVDIDANDIFEEITLKKGTLSLTIRNGFPVPLEDIQFELRNWGSANTIIADTLARIDARGSISKDYSLAGKTLEGDLELDVINLNTPGSGGNFVLIDTTDALEVTLTGKNMKLQSARARFSAQNVVEDTSLVEYKMGGAQLKRLDIKKGFIEVFAVHTIQDSLYLTYSIPGATRGGKPLVVHKTLPPAPPGDNSVVTKRYDVDGYRVDLEQGPKGYNTFNTMLTLSIDSSGKMVELSLDDKILINYGLYSVKPAYASGYLGKDSFTTHPQRTEIPFFQQTLKNGMLELKDVNFTLSAYNSLGVDGKLEFSNLIAQNTHKNKTLKVKSQDLKNIKVPSALDHPLRPSVTRIQLTPDNSNITEVFNLIPDHFIYNLNVSLNPSGIPGQFDDFIYNESSIEADAEVEFPAVFKTKNLTLYDTAGFTFPTIDSFQNIQSATLKLIATNSFPLEARVQFYFYDADNKIIDSLYRGSPNLIKAGKISSQAGKVIEPAKTEIESHFGQKQLKKIKNTSKVIIRSSFSTIPKDQHIKIYNDYYLKTALVTELNYRVKY